MFLLSRLPLITLLAAVAVYSFTLFLTVTSGVGVSAPINVILVLLLALAVILMFLAQNPNNESAALMFWFGAGVSGAAAYLNFQMLGVVHLVIALGAAVSAFLIERESRVFSFAGPALFIGTGLALVIVAVLVTR